jgi:hypothetical protein
VLLRRPGPDAFGFEAGIAHDHASHRVASLVRQSNHGSRPAGAPFAPTFPSGFIPVGNADPMHVHTEALARSVSFLRSLPADWPSRSSSVRILCA